MTPDLAQDLTALGRISRRFRPARWFATGTEIWMGRAVIGYTKTPEAADYICRLHNIFQRLANEAIVLTTEVQDLTKALSVRRR